MNKKPIEISKSSLLSLKAEVLRKQEEVFKAKLQSKCQQAVPKPKPKPLKNIGVEERNANDISEEDVDALAKSKLALEAKSKLYDHLSKRSARNDPLNKQYLVQFDRKFIDEDDDDVDKYPEEEEEEEVTFDPSIYKSNNPDEEWVDYVDCLGRTRKCLRKDLPHVQSRDKELSESLPSDKKIPQESTNEKIDNQAVNTDLELENITDVELSENNEMLSNDMRKELLRKQWEKEEEELRLKSDIHYQDVLFNEARTHGVGYFSFSKDDKIRKQQQEQLKKLREETKQKQSTVQEQRALREQQLAARAKAARNRKRARMGLPPEEDEEKPIEPEPKEETNSKENELLQQKEQEEKAKELERKKQIRPWDIGKRGTREVKSQEEWVEEKRGERKTEFAPPPAYDFDRRYRLFPDPEDFEEEPNLLFFTSKKNDKTPKWRDHSQADLHKPSSSTSEPVNPYKRSFEPTPIVNLCEERSDAPKRYPEQSMGSSDEDSEEENTSLKRKRAEIPPPPTFEYYGPNSKQLRPKPIPNTELKASIEAGLKFLRKQSEKKHAQTDHVGYFE